MDIGQAGTMPKKKSSDANSLPSLRTHNPAAGEFMNVILKLQQMGRQFMKEGQQ